MKNLIKLSFIAALTMFSVAQAADIDTVTVTPNNSDMLTQHHYAMQASEFYQYKRAYELSNGMTMSVYNVGPIMYAQLNDQARERIVATSGNEFASTRSNLKMHINLQADGAASGEVYIPLGSSTGNLGNAHQQHIVASLH